MTRLRFSLVLILTVMSCAASRVRPLDQRGLQAINAAEAFVARHGYTIAGHPADKPVENVEVLDPLATPEELVAWRRATLEARAFGIVKGDDGDSFYVLFRRLGGPDAGFRAVLVQATEAVQVVHSVLVLEDLHWRPVPSDSRELRKRSSPRSSPT